MTVRYKLMRTYIVFSFISVIINMATLVLPFLLILMRPVPYYLVEIIGNEYYPSTLTPVMQLQTANVSNPFKFSTRIGAALPVPLYAELQQSMTNEVKIYQQFKTAGKQSLQIIKRYYYSNCDDDVLKFTESREDATTFYIHTQDDALHTTGGYFHISCLKKYDRKDCNSTGTNLTTTLKKFNTLNVTKTDKETFQLQIDDTNKDNTETIHVMYPVMGQISPYYMQGDKEDTVCN